MVRTARMTSQNHWRTNSFSRIMLMDRTHCTACTVLSSSAALELLSVVCKTNRLVGLVVKTSASRAENPGFDSRLHERDFSWSSHSGDFKIGTPVATPARRLALQGQRWNWLAGCQYTVTGGGRKFDQQLLSQCGNTCNCLSRSVSWDTLACCWDVKQTNQQTAKQRQHLYHVH